jgi:hypothetical protein
VQPFQLRHKFRGELNAFRINDEAATVDLASAADYIQIAAGGLGVEDRAVIIFNLLKTAETALVTL